MPSTLFDPSLSLRRLRTTPARNPRTECCCGPVAFIIAAIVAPAGDCSIAMTRDCFEPGSALCGRGGLAIASGDGFAAVVSVCAGRDDRFFADFDIEILRLVDGGVAPHHQSPTSGMEPAGQDLGARMRSGLTTLPLQSRPNASPFWIILLLSSTVFGHGMIDADQMRGKKRPFATTFLSSSPACPATQSGLCGPCLIGKNYTRARLFVLRASAAVCHQMAQRVTHRRIGVSAMAGKTPKKSAKVAKKTAAKRVAAKPVLLSGGNPQIAKGYGDAPVQAYIAAMPGWKRDVGRRLDALIVRTVPGVRKAVKWNSPFYGVEHEGSRLVPQLSLLHEVHQSDFLPRHVAASCPAGPVQTQGRALPRHPRGRTRRSAVRRLGEASEPIARRTNVSGECAA